MFSTTSAASTTELMYSRWRACVWSGTKEVLWLCAYACLLSDVVIQGCCYGGAGQPQSYRPPGRGACMSCGAVAERVSPTFLGTRGMDPV